MEEALRSFTSVKVLIPHCENTLLQVKFNVAADKGGALNTLSAG